MLTELRGQRQVRTWRRRGNRSDLEQEAVSVDFSLSLSGTQSPHLVSANDGRESVLRKHPRAALPDPESCVPY